MLQMFYNRMSCHYSWKFRKKTEPSVLLCVKTMAIKDNKMP
jgi:hypothetical protein